MDKIDNSWKPLFDKHKDLLNKINKETNSVHDNLLIYI